MMSSWCWVRPTFHSSLRLRSSSYCASAPGRRHRPTAPASPSWPGASPPIARVSWRTARWCARRRIWFPQRCPCPRVFNDHPDLLAFALKHAVLLRSGVTRPGLYPVAGQSDVAALARTAGGGSEKLAVVDGAGLNRQKSDQPAGAARRGDIVDATTPRFELVGHVRYPGTRALAGAGTLRQVLGDGSQNLAGLYPLFGVIERQDRSRMTSRLIPFSPHEVISGSSDRPLADGDRVRLFSATEIRALMQPEREPGRDKTAPEVPTVLPTEPAEAALRSLMIEHAVIVQGAVRQPGSYPVDGQVRLEMMMATAGGLT